MWHFNEANGNNFHHYYLAFKSNGTLELGRKDNTVQVDEQYFLSTGVTYSYTVNTWNLVRVKSVGNAITVWIDGVQKINIVDDGAGGAQGGAPNTPAVPSAAMYTGKFGLYNEDAQVEFSPLTITTLGGASAGAPITSTYITLATDTSLTNERMLAVGSNKLSLTDGGAGANITVDVVEANLTHNNIGGTLGVSKGGTGAATLTGILKGNGTSAFTAVTAPTGAIVGTTDTQTLTGKSSTALIQTSHEDFTAIAVPSAPGAGVIRKYADSGNSNHIRSINSAGTITDYDNVDFLESARTRYGFVEDFVTQVTSSAGLGGLYFVNFTNAGAGSTVTTVNITNANQFGIISYQTGTTTTGRAGGSPTLLGQLRLGQGLMRYDAYIRFPTLSDGTETYLARFGFLDSQSADAVDGVYFEYDSTVSANWRTNTSNNSTRTKTSSAIAVDTNFNRLSIIVNAAGTSASFYVNGTELTGSSASPITTNIPTGAGRETSIMHHIIKSAGTTNRTMEFDYIAMQCDLTTRR
jgi:hypothetical protein